ncbi:MAG: hypothetical protein QM500_14400 [Methylococcales bacterium]
MVFEDLTDGDFRAIGAKLPTALTFPHMKKSLEEIKNLYQLNETDAATAFFIAQESTAHYKAIDRIISYRVEDLLSERAKLGLVT